ncbi:autotransporter domain-containing protein [Vogesella sp. LIG4]|uniref:autotransporter outer membrane beta-barrel domain-containing protein n=1 Tax=Vogesella sp. LIG4 TaxID=1192162 RepID=UPI00081FC4A6|nr:autotransporter domain-containing protein [Vogesella sp. LIG4]SCK24678.1 outer membrane autotransporter barrel domain-containing protein [Vogesella sp. LIG4]
MKTGGGHYPKQKTLVLAIAAALTGIVSINANAGTSCPQVDTPVSSALSWSAGDCTVTTSITSSVNFSPAMYVSTGSVGTLTNSGTISGNSWGGIGFSNGGSIGSIAVVNNESGGLISGAVAGLTNVGVIGTLNNSGTISTSSDSGGTTAIVNYGSITALNNQSSGLISSSTSGVKSTGTIGTLSNSGTIIGGYIAINNAGLIDTLTNSGTLSGYNGLDNGGTINTLSNSGTISTGRSGINNNGNIGTLSNSGLISVSSGTGISNGGSIGTLTNSGTISGSSGGIYNSGAIGTLNNSGTISGSSYAIYNDTYGSIGQISNTGVIAGNIHNASANDLTVSGGSGSTFGTLTGYGGTIGTISNTASNVVFSSGNQLLNDNINVGSNAVNNIGATLQVNNPLSITGNYSQGASATLQIGVADGAVATGSIADDSGYGRLVVSGSATIASGSSVALQKTGSYAFAAGQRFVVIDASSSGTNYNEGTLNYSIKGATGSVLTGADVTSGANSDLVVTVVNAGSAASGTARPTTPVAVSSLNGLQNYSGIDSGLLGLFNASLAIGSTAEANRAGAQLAPSQNFSAGNATSVATFDTLSVVGAHADTLRLAQTNGQSGVATGDSPLEWGAWGQLLGGHAHQGMIDQVSGYSANYSGIVLGADRGFAERWRAGGAFSYSSTSVDGADNLAGSSSRVDAYGLIGYASYIGSPWYLNLSASVLQHDYRSTRDISFSGFAGQAHADYKGQQYVGKAEFGYPLALAGNMTLTPLASLSYSYLHQDGYTETGGNGAALAVQSTHNEAVRSSLGGKLEKTLQSSYGEVVPYAQLLWTHQYNRSRMATTASYAADSTGETGFTTLGATPVADMGELALGVNLLKSDNLTLSARYDLQAAPHYMGQTISLRLRKLF